MNNLDIDKSILDFEQFHRNQIVREYVPISFGSKADSMHVFRETFCKVDKTCKKFIFLPEYEEVIKWMTDTKGKGLFLMGDCGRGKSTIITGVIPILYYIFFKKIVKPVQAEEIPDKIEHLILSKYIAIDDLGVEPKISNFGNPYEGFNKIIGIAESKINPLFVSTNLTDNEILNRYGERTMDRICRLCKVIKFKGDSLR